MQPAILALGTAVPKFEINQRSLAITMSKALEFNEKYSSLLERIFINSKIERRQSVIPDYQNIGLQGKLYQKPLPHNNPCTKSRNEIYKKEAPKLAFQAAKTALDQWGQDSSKITHVISISCTGMMAPGIESFLIDNLKLQPDCTRLGINYMGCFGAFQGLAAGHAFCLGNPNHRILMVCTELCTLHMQIDPDPGTIVGNALFSDGAAAVVIGGNPVNKEKPLWNIIKHSSYKMDHTSQEMTWEVGNNGYVMTLTEKVPKWIYKSSKMFIEKLIEKKCEQNDCSWAVHPGGKDILKAIAEACELKSEEDLHHSWEVMRNFGNMSSPTFLFVLNEMLKHPNSKPWTIGLGFGPGLALEGVLLKNVF